MFLKKLLHDKPLYSSVFIFIAPLAFFLISSFGTENPIEKDTSSSSAAVHAFNLHKSDLRRMTLKNLYETTFLSATGKGKDSLYIHLIQRYNNDFFGKTLGLNSDDEKLLFTFMQTLGFDEDNLCGLNRPFSNDSSQTMRLWLLRKVGSSTENSPYFNPVYASLLSRIKELETRLDMALSVAATEHEKRLVLSEDRYALKPVNQPFTEDYSNFLAENDSLLYEARGCYKELRDYRRELSIRLGLLNIFIAKEYGAWRDVQLFAWMMADFKGLNLYRKSWPRLKRYPELKHVAEKVRTLLAHNKKNQKTYSRLGVTDSPIRLFNPLRVPLEAKDVGQFGARRKNKWGKVYGHNGVDLIADAGTPVYAVRDGLVEYVGNNGNGHGNHIKIRHDNGVRSSYSHLSNDRLWRETRARFRQEGPFWISAHQPLASVGTTGNIPRYDEQYGYAHLHLEVRVNGRIVNPTNLLDTPLTVLDP